MRTIRSLLWIGSGRGLAESGVTEAPELDVTWVPDLDEAIRLPRVHFDGLLLEPTEATIGDLAESIGILRRVLPRTSLLVCGSTDLGIRPDQAVRAGADGALLFDSARSGPGIVSEINEALDAIRDAKRTGGPTRSAAEMPDRPSTQASGPTADHPNDEAAAPRFITASPAMQAVSSLVDLAASSPSTVLLTGETGVGKEVIANELHHRSGRKNDPFVAINCAAFPESLLESELFGHVRGAFTGATQNKTGLFEAAAGGTLLLDEIAEMGLALQAKLLRVLQEREIRPIGGTHSTPIRCRILAATNRVLSDEVASGHFREDLFYRLNVFPIRIPPLRERQVDILPLARHFLARHGPREGKPGCHLSLASGQLLESYGWPGNVRELENEILRALMLTPAGELITPKALSPKIVEILEPIAQGARPDETLREALDRVESWLIRRALTNNGGRKARTAKRLGLTREGLYKKIKRLGIE